jgi:preprotein translocase subunit Sss1
MTECYAVTWPEVALAAIFLIGYLGYLYYLSKD